MTGFSKTFASFSRLALRAIGVVLLLLAALVGVGAAFASPGAAVDPAQQEATETPTPFVQPTLPPSPTPYCPRVPRNRLIVNERGRVSEDDPSPLNIREGPQTSFEILGSMASGEIFYVLEGPRCSERYSWYRVRYGEIEGWIAEGTGSLYFAEPYLPG